MKENNDLRESAMNLICDFGEFSVLGMVYASEKRECPGFWYGDLFIEENVLFQITEYFSERYHYYEPTVDN